MNNKILRNTAYCAMMVVFVGIILRIGFLQVTESKVPKKFTESTISLADVEENVASLNMVLTHVKNIGNTIHNAGTAENGVVKDYIMSVLDKQQIPYEVQPFTFDVENYARESKKTYDEAMSQYPEIVEKNNAFLAEKGYEDFIDYTKDIIGLRDETTVTMNNILAEFDAPNTEDAIVFVTHYDSRPDVAGSTGSALGVSAFLEAARLLSSSGELTNDIYFLFTDGKEIDLLGAKEFVSKHEELMKHVKVLLNFDSQGTEGALTLYETSDNDYNVVKQYKEAVSKNSGYSFLASTCKLLPHDTDFRVFSEAGVSAMNFSVLEGANEYSRSIDTSENLNRGSAYEYMNTINELVSYYSTNKIPVVEKERSAVFFTFLRGNIVVLPSGVVGFVTYITSMLAIGLLVFFKLRKKIRFRFVARSTIFSILAMLVTGLGSAVVLAPSLKALSSIDTKTEWNESQLIFLISIGMAFLFVGVFTFVSMKRNKHQLSTLMGQLPILLTMGLIMGNDFISLSYVFTVAIWMVFLAIIVCIALEKKPVIQKWCYVGMLVVFGVILSILFTPIIYMAYMSLSIQIIIIMAVISCIPISLLFVLIITVWKELVIE